MRKKAMMTVFLLVFTGIYTAMHYYALGRLVTWFGGTIGIPFIIVTTLLILSFPFASLIANYWSNRATHTLYSIAATWMGTLAILLLFVVLGEIGRIFIAENTLGLIIIGITIITAIYALLNAAKISVREFTISGDVKKAYTIAVASDVHAGPAHGKHYVERIVHEIQKYDVDLVLLPGDLVDGPGKLPEDLLEPLNALNIPIYYSFGNHEHYVGEKEVERVVKRTKIKILRDEAVKHGEITIIGIDDREDRNTVKNYLPEELQGYTILMYHRPDGLKDAAKKGIDLVLSGHTHNGQVFPFTLFVKMRFPRIKGWYKRGNTKHFVSTGAGTWGPPMRLGSKSEIAIITIKPARA